MGALPVKGGIGAGNSKREGRLLPCGSVSDAHGNIPEDVRAKLEELSARRDELEHSLSDPETLADHSKVRELSIKKAALDPVVGRYKRYRSLQDEIAELTSAIASGEDAELAEMARDELPGVV